MERDVLQRIEGLDVPVRQRDRGGDAVGAERARVDGAHRRFQLRPLRGGLQAHLDSPTIRRQEFGSEDEAIALGNGVEYGLAALMRTGGTSRSHRVSRALDFGQIWINCHLIQAAEMPNGGFKGSGHGNDLSALALADYTRVNHIMTAVP